MEMEESRNKIDDRIPCARFMSDTGVQILREYVKFRMLNDALQESVCRYGLYPE